MNGVILKFHQLETDFPIALPKKYISNYEYQGASYLMLELEFEYEENGAIGFGWCCFPKSSCLGYHEGDIESIFILYDHNSNPRHIYFKAHGRGQGMWVPYHECETENGKLVAYVARASHAFYPYAKIWWRIFFLASDLTSNTGAKREYSIPEISSGPITKYVPKGSVTQCQRCCLCCCLNSVRDN